MVASTERPGDEADDRHDRNGSCAHPPPGRLPRPGGGAAGAAFEPAPAEARRARSPDAYAAALRLYTGELLPEDRFEDWAAARREALTALQHALQGELARL